MFFAGSRYIPLSQYTVTLPDGTVVSAVKPAIPGLAAVQGFYRRQTGDRLDQIAARFLSDATQFWHVCDSCNTMAPDALAARDLVGVPIDAPQR